MHVDSMIFTDSVPFFFVLSSDVVAFSGVA